MLNKLSEKLKQVLDKVREKGKISKDDLRESFREIKLALLEADVHYKVVKDFIYKLEEMAQQEILSQTLTPGQQIIKMTHTVLTEILGERLSKINFSEEGPTNILLIGLQGSGKTTTAAKLALLIKKMGHLPVLVAADKIRPAAIEQLLIMGERAGVDVFTNGIDKSALHTIYDAQQWAKEHKRDVLIIDSAGRLHIDNKLIKELKDIKDAIKVHETLLVIDALMGQDALRMAEDFNKEVGIDGYILTKLDGDARGGVALSVRSITNLPIKFTGIGEKITDLEPFYPERISSRILGMGDTLTLIEKIESSFEANEIREFNKKEFRGQFNLNDFYEQFKRIKKMGSLESIFNLMPSQFAGSVKSFKQNVGNEEKALNQVEAIISSMTNKERLEPEIINGRRKRRIANGSGTSVNEVNRLLNQFSKMKKILKQQGSKKSFISFMR